MKQKIFTSIGLMSGTSMDGVDLSVIKSDGNDQFSSIYDTYKEFDDGLYKQLISLRDKISNFTDLKTHSKNLSDKVVKIKMNEAIKSINKFCGLDDKSNVVKDEYVIQTMRYLELVKELKKSGNKKQKVI